MKTIRWLLAAALACVPAAAQSQTELPAQLRDVGIDQRLTRNGLLSADCPPFQEQGTCMGHRYEAFLPQILQKKALQELYPHVQLLTLYLLLSPCTLL